MNNYTVICGFLVNHYKHPVIKQPGFNGKYFFSVAYSIAMLVYQRVQILLMEEILHQWIGSLCHYLQGFIHPRWLAGFRPSTVLLNIAVAKYQVNLFGI